MITKLEFSIDIPAPKATIWHALWDDAMYRDWAGVFFEGSYAVSSEDWKEGSTVHFLAPDQSGIYSTIEKHIPNEIIQFKHIGTVADGKEQPIDEDTKKWTGSTEIYRIIEGENTNTILVEIDIMNEHLDFMKERFPIALKRIKGNCGET